MNLAWTGNLYLSSLRSGLVIPL
ncbi:hypothetical protein F383_28916 [Gossypium arboreum]|uniref:Uncharacterized protein n=1 Tax=Gossypium arboreum TaxID=29729 RepID=A0A0B0MTG4_GOSAR|nr:hypothetical protein F383_28916 [Gossypium arboreum]